MQRTLFFNEVTVDGVQELDFLDHSLTGFQFTRAPMYYRVSQGDLYGAPDLIAYKMYGDERQWWVICLVNEIACPALDITIGQLLKIPSLLDIYDFFKTYRKR